MPIALGEGDARAEKREGRYGERGERQISTAAAKGGGREAYLGITSSRPHKHHHHTQIDLNSHRFLTKILNSSRFPTKLSQPAGFEQLLPRKKSPNIHLAPHLRGRTLNKKPPLKSPK